MKIGRLIYAIALAAVLSCCSDAMSQSTKRKALKPRRSLPAQVVAVVSADTITGEKAIDSLVSLSGYKKTVMSRVETIMITNLSTTDTIRTVEVDIDYRTPEGRQLNRRQVVFDAVVPPGETRHASVTSWDRQQLFYYVATPPVKKTQRTSPFDVRLRILKVIVNKP